MKPSNSQRTQVVLEQAPQKQSAFNIKNIFKVDQTIEVSIFRLYLMRFFSAQLRVAGVERMAWTDHSRETVGPHVWHCDQLLGSTVFIERFRDSISIKDVAVAHYATGLQINMGAGSWPSAGQLSPMADELFSVCSKGLVVDLLVIPWSFVLANYVKAPSDRWR